MYLCVCVCVCVHVCVCLCARACVLAYLTCLLAYLLTFLLIYLLASCQEANKCKMTPPPQKKNMSTKGKCIYPNLRQPPNKNFAKKKYFTINFMHLKHKTYQILSTFTNQCHCLSLHSQCLHLPHTHS